MEVTSNGYYSAASPSITTLWSTSLLGATVKLSGPDAKRYLHGRLTQSVNDLKSGESKRTLILSSNGRIEGSGIICLAGEDYFLISDPLPDAESITAFFEALMHFKVADRVDAALLDDNFSVVHIFTTARQGEFNPDGGFAIAAGSRDNLSYWRVTIPTDKLASFTGGFSAATQLLTSESVLSFLTELGYFCHLTHSNPSTLAPELDLSPFTKVGKGCFTGQEVVEMASARGKTAYQLALLTLPPTLPLPLTEQPFPITADNKQVGTIVATGLSKAIVRIKSEYIDQELLLDGQQAANICRQLL